MYPTTVIHLSRPLIKKIERGHARFLHACPLCSFPTALVFDPAHLHARRLVVVVLDHGFNRHVAPRTHAPRLVSATLCRVSHPPAPGAWLKLHLEGGVPWRKTGERVPRPVQRPRRKRGCGNGANPARCGENIAERAIQIRVRHVGIPVAAA